MKIDAFSRNFRYIGSAKRACKGLFLTPAPAGLNRTLEELKCVMKRIEGKDVVGLNRTLEELKFQYGLKDVKGYAGLNRTLEELKLRTL